MIMTSSPLLHSLPGTPPNSSPSLRPKQLGSGSMTPIASISQQVSTLSCSAPIGSSLAAAITASTTTSTTSTTTTTTTTTTTQHRSYARAPPIRPYQSPLLSRGAKLALDVQGDTKQFGEMVVHLVEERSRRARKGQHQHQPQHEHQHRDRDHPTTTAMHQDISSSPGAGEAEGEKRMLKSAGGSMAGSWEQDRVELIVDVPVWTPGCFQDLSTLHALRDTTLSHTHSLLTFLQRDHSLPSSYRLLARSTTGNNAHVGWGCIRLAPSLHSPLLPKKELKPAVRRSSFVHENAGVGASGSRRRSNEKHRDASGSTAEKGKASTTAASVPMPMAMPKPSRVQEAFESDSAVIIDEDDDVEEQSPTTSVKLLEGYLSGTTSDEEEEESADEIVAREVEKRGAKEGEAFLMTLFGQPALILT